MEALADLHRHLDGSLRPSTVADLAAHLDLIVPHDLPFYAGMGLDEALSRFAFTLSLLQQPDAVRRVASEMCEDAAAENVTRLEIRFAPQLHKGASVEAIVDAALEGVAGRAGLVLCGLYGEPPQVLERLVEVARTRRGVVGIDLAGGPRSGHSWNMSDYAPAYERAAELGIGRTVHAGEGRPPAEIAFAVERLHAGRVGHATTLLDDPRVVELVIDRGVTIEACPSSNVHTGCIPSVEAHPLPRWIDAGVRACLCSDNTLLSQTSATEEHRRMEQILGRERLRKVIGHGHRAAFVRGPW